LHDGRTFALDADRDLFDAELSLAQARLSELLSLDQFYRALGKVAGMKVLIRRQNDNRTPEQSERIFEI
jgi:hypothetical protein